MSSVLTPSEECKRNFSSSSTSNEESNIISSTSAAATSTCVGPSSDNAGKAPSCSGCPMASMCAAGAFKNSVNGSVDPDIAAITTRLSSVRYRILILSGKGGVGKSTLTRELGFAFGRLGRITGLIDADICGPSLPRMTGVREEEVHISGDGWEAISIDENVSMISMHFVMGDNKNEAVMWRGPKKNGMIKNFLKEVSWGDKLDILLVDTPPGTSDEHISTATLLQQCGGVSGAVIVTTPQEVALADVRREINFCKKTKIPILGIVENMSGFVCPKCKHSSIIFPCKYKEGSGARLANEYDVSFFGAIPLDPLLMDSCDKGIPLEENLKADSQKDSCETLKIFEIIAKKILEKLE